MAIKLSIIVPVRNEAAGLPAFLADLSARIEADLEVVFVDGGSTDGTPALLRVAGFGVLGSAPGRASQMNAGAAAARGEVLLFLHADTCLPKGFANAIARGLSGGKRWGRFDVVLVGRPVLLKLVAAMMNLRSRLTGIATGDQALFVRREAFDAVGGFPAQALMEDIEISRRLKRISPPACLRARVRTSARRWETRGLWRTVFLMWQLRWSYWRGVPADELARRYR